MTQWGPPPYDPPPVPPLAYAGPGVAGGDRDARLWAMVAHLSGLPGFAVPFGHVLGPLVIWLLKRDASPFVDDQAKEAVNFQLTATIAVLIAVATFCVGIGVVLLPVVAVAQIVLVVIDAVAANAGRRYRYPLTIRFVR